MFTPTTTRSLATLLALGATTVATAGGVTLNEIRTSMPGADDDEFFELAGAPGTSLDGLTYLVIGDTGDDSGIIEAVIDLTGQSIPASGLFVAAEGTFSIGVADFTTTLNFENSDQVTHLLVEGFSGMDGDDLDTDDDGTLDVEPWGDVLDAVGFIVTTEVPPPAGINWAYGAFLGFEDVGPDGEFVPGGVYRCTPDGTWIVAIFAIDDDTPGDPNQACPIDTDGDGVPDDIDNCPDNANPSQRDCDGNGIGDVCEILEGTQTDANGNGLPDECEVDPPSGLALNEIRLGMPGTDTDEYVELTGPASTSLDGLSVIVIGDGIGGSGVIETVIPLTGGALGLDGVGLIANDTMTLVAPGEIDVVAEFFIEDNDNVTFLLVANFLGGLNDDLDDDDDGTLDAEPWTHLLDVVGVVRSTEMPPVETEWEYATFLGGPVAGPDGEFAPAHVAPLQRHVGRRHLRPARREHHRLPRRDQRLRRFRQLPGRHRSVRRRRLR